MPGLAYDGRLRKEYNRAFLVEPNANRIISVMHQRLQDHPEATAARQI